MRRRTLAWFSCFLPVILGVQTVMVGLLVYVILEGSHRTPWVMWRRDDLALIYPEFVELGTTEGKVGYWRPWMAVSSQKACEAKITSEISHYKNKISETMQIEPGSKGFEVLFTKNGKKAKVSFSCFPVGVDPIPQIEGAKENGDKS